MDLMLFMQLLLRILLFCLVVVVVIWGIRSGQFRKMEKAASLPLDIEEDKEENKKI